MVVNGFDDDQTRSFTNLAAGAKVLHYEVISKIGAGGMGEVYLALDTKLNRRVALKFLPPHLCQDDDCRKRFTREAQAAAGLDHANIAAIYEVGEFHDRPFYAMQVVEGQSLKEVIAAKDLSLDRILEITMQVCEGLQAAHDKGIIHRDVKPSNILLDGHGRVRIVDFGLAAIRGSEHLTKTGSTLGTIGYMSPEQVQGKEIDHRSDLFSLGVVLYELITSQSPFKRDSEAATLKAVCDDLPEPLARFKSGLPEGLQSIVERALEKDVKTRFQTASGMLADLTRLKRMMDSEESAVSLSRPVRLSSRMWWAAVVVVLAAAVALSVWILRNGSGPSMITYRQVTYFGDVDKCEISPDGSFYAISRVIDDQHHLYVSDLSGSKPIELLTCQQLSDFRWSPNGQELAVAYWSDSSNHGCIVVPKLGGSARRLDNYGFADHKVAWSPDGRRLVQQASVWSTDSLYVVDVSSLKRGTLPLKVDLEWSYNLDWSPIDKWILMTTNYSSRDALWVLALDGNESVELVSGDVSAARWSPDGGAIYFVKRSEVSGGLWTATIDTKSARLKHPPRLQLPGVRASGLSVSQDGSKAMYTSPMVSSNLWQAALDTNLGNSVEQLTIGTANVGHPAISPDGKRIAYSLYRDGRADIYLLSLESSGKSERLTFDGILNTSPSWSPDGRKLVYVYSSDDKNFHIKTIDVGSRQSKTYEMTVAERATWPHWEVDGNVYYRKPSNRNINILDLETETQKRLISESEESEGWIFSPSVSPDGESVAVFWNNKERGRGLYLISLVDASVQQLIRTRSIIHPIKWSSDGQWLYYTDHQRIIRINCFDNQQDTLMSLPFEVESWEVWQIYPDISPDLSFVVCGQVEFKQDAWLIEDFGPNVD